MENPIDRNLPQELILEIILQLPVKSLLRFKCVSTGWNTLIGSPGFANQHFAHKSNQEHLLFPRYDSDRTEYALALYMDDILSQYEEPDHLQIPDSIPYFMGPLNGVFCMVNFSRKIALLNPAMRQFRLLPDLVPSSYIQPHLSFDKREGLGFGLDAFGNYKLVFVQYVRDKERGQTYYPCIISVYNSSSDTWRHFEEMNSVNYERSIYKPLVNTYLNGVYYWLMVHVDDTPSTVYILAFDMRIDKFREIKGPNGIKTVHVELCLYGNALALLWTEDHKFVNVWVMESEGEWSRFFKIGPVEGIRWPLGFWKQKELLLDTNKVLSMYNVCTETLRTFEDHKHGFYVFWVFIYKESLVSIKGEGDNCYLWDVSSDIVKDFFTRPMRNRTSDSDDSSITNESDEDESDEEA